MKTFLKFILMHSSKFYFIWKYQQCVFGHYLQQNILKLGTRSKTLFIGYDCYFVEGDSALLIFMGQLLENNVDNAGAEEIFTFCLLDYIASLIVQSTLIPYLGF